MENGNGRVISGFRKGGLFELSSCGFIVSCQATFSGAIYGMFVLETDGKFFNCKGGTSMQNMELRSFQKVLNEHGYIFARNTGSSHTVYERRTAVGERVFKDTISIPTSNKTINGPLPKRLIKQIYEFEDYVNNPD